MNKSLLPCAIIGAIASAMVALFFLLSITGCALFTGKSIVSPYEAGRIFVFADTTVKSIEPAEVKTAVGVVYGIAKADLDAENITDELVQAQIEAQFPDATPEYRAVLFALYRNLTLKITDQIGVHSDLPKLTVIDEFNRGIRDALELYQPTE